MKNGGFRIRRVIVSEHGFTYPTFQLVGYLRGVRIRRRFKTQDEALGEKNRLEVVAANTGELSPVNTRLSPSQIQDAEAAIHRLGATPLSAAVEWYLTTYRPPVVRQMLNEAVAGYLRAKQPHVQPVHYDDVRCKLDWLLQWFPESAVHEIRAEILEQQMLKRGWAPKTWNNVRGCFHAFFDYCAGDSRRWAVDNPAARIAGRRVARGIPHIESASKLREMFKFLEDYTGGTRRPQAPGFLVPYFALATFAGLRPSVPDGEIWKLGHLENHLRFIDLAVGVIRISPEIAKTNAVRQIRIRPNLVAWLGRYSPKTHPIIVRNMQSHVSEVRARFELADDVLRHTWISAHVATFKSLGEAALEAGNSESIIRRHYLNLMSEAEATDFWSISPQPAAATSGGAVAS